MESIPKRIDETQRLAGFTKRKKGAGGRQHTCGSRTSIIKNVLKQKGNQHAVLCISCQLHKCLWKVLRKTALLGVLRIRGVKNEYPGSADLTSQGPLGS